MTTNHVFKGGDIIRVLSPHDAKLRRANAGKVYRLECDGPALFVLRDVDGTSQRRYLRAELDRMAAAGRIALQGGDR